MPLAEITHKFNGEAFTAIFWRNSYSSKHGISNGHLNGQVVRISLVVQWLGTHRAVLCRGVWFLLRALRPHVLQWLSLHPTNSRVHAPQWEIHMAQQRPACTGKTWCSQVSKKKKETQTGRLSVTNVLNRGPTGQDTQWLNDLHTPYSFSIRYFQISYRVFSNIKCKRKTCVKSCFVKYFQWLLSYL